MERIGSDTRVHTIHLPAVLYAGAYPNVDSLSCGLVVSVWSEYRRVQCGKLLGGLDYLTARPLRPARRDLGGSELPDRPTPARSAARYFAFWGSRNWSHN